MGGQHSLVLTIKKIENVGEVVLSASIRKTSEDANISIGSIIGIASSFGADEKKTGSDHDVCDSVQVVVPIPRGLDFSKEFYLYVPSAYLYDVPQTRKSDQGDHRKQLVRSGISVVQNLAMGDDDKILTLMRLLEYKINDLNTITVKTAEAMQIVANIIASKSKNAYESKLTQNCADGASDIYKCQITPNESNDEPVQMEKVCCSTYFLEQNPNSYDEVWISTKIIQSASSTSSIDHNTYFSAIKWETIFPLIMPAHRLAVDQCLNLQHEIDKVKAVGDAIKLHKNGLGAFGVELSNKCFFKREELEKKLAAAAWKILSGK